MNGIKGFFQTMLVVILYFFYVVGLVYIGLYIYPRYPFTAFLMLIIYVPSPLIVSNWHKIFERKYPLEHSEYLQEPDLIEVEAPNREKTENLVINSEQYKTKKISPLLFQMVTVELILSVIFFVAVLIFKFNTDYEGELFFLLLLVAFFLYVVSLIEEKYGNKFQKKAINDNELDYIVLNYFNHYVFCFSVTAIILTFIYIILSTLSFINISPSTIIIVLLIIIIFQLSDKNNKDD